MHTLLTRPIPMPHHSAHYPAHIHQEMWSPPASPIPPIYHAQRFASSSSLLLADQDSLTTPRLLLAPIDYSVGDTTIPLDLAHRLQSVTPDCHSWAIQLLSDDDDHSSTIPSNNNNKAHPIVGLVHIRTHQPPSKNNPTFYSLPRRPSSSSTLTSSSHSVTARRSTSISSSSSSTSSSWSHTTSCPSPSSPSSPSSPFHVDSPHHPTLDIYISPLYRSQGYATEAAKHIVKHLLFTASSSHATTAITAVTTPAYPAQERVWEKLGMVQTSHLGFTPLTGKSEGQLKYWVIDQRSFAELWLE
ncbi:hypothetical protein DFS34DRAFT_603177 [Phlyctochytrium arcticum]|nr:hypothetical protein DFS34DRAFT_603177 [Phlyctochytrium arcticum]